MKSILLIFCLCMLSFDLSAQGFQWAHNQTGGASTIDNDGNIYTVNFLRSTVDFDAGPGVYNMTPLGNYADLFILKQDANGNFIWAKQISTPGNSQISNFAGGFSITVDSLDYVYISGNFYNTVDFDPGSGVFELSTTTMDYFLLKLNSSGDFVWAKNAGNATGTSYVTVSGHQQDADGNIYTASSFRGTIDADPGPDTNNVYTPSGNVIADILITKLDSAGNFIWAKQAGGQGTNVPIGIALDSFANIYFAGSFNNTADFDPSSGTAILNFFGGTNYGGDVFVAKWDSAGNYIWAKQIGGTESETATAITVDLHGNPLVVGVFGGPADFDPGPSNFTINTSFVSTPFAFRLTTNGDFSWAESIASQGDARGIVTDDEGNVYIGGSAGASADYDPGPLSYSLPNGNAFIQKLDSYGNFKWAIGIGNNNYESIEWLGVDKWNNLYACGAYSGNVDFDQGANTYLMNGNIGSSFMLKLCPSAPVLLEASALTGCYGLDTIILSTAPLAGATYTWAHNDAVVQTGSSNTLGATESGYYEVTVTGLGCPATSNRVELDFAPSYYPSIQSLFFGTGLVTVTAWGPVHLYGFGRYNQSGTNINVPVPTPYQVEWLRNGVPFDTTYDSFSINYMPIAVGYDTITVILSVQAQPCFDTVSGYVILNVQPSGIEDVQGNGASITVYPNPATGFFNAIGIERGNRLLLKDLSGRTIRSWSATPSKQSYDVSGIAAGYYMLCIEDGKGKLIATKKLIKQ